ncbi:MAG TPA: hypothetical protein VGJ18_12300 [Gemmatimonadaceae bacterium]|jgi:hypothetical protein
MTAPRGETSRSDIDALHERWTAAWPDALAAWSRFTRLRPPTLCLTEAQAKAEGLTGSFAMIRLVDQAVIVSLPAVATSGVESFAVEVLAHEIGHHVLAPSTLTDHGRSLARMRRALPTVEQHAPMVANLYTDLLINDRLQRSAGLSLSSVYRALARSDGSAPKEGGALWTLYLRIYEILWRLERGALGGGTPDDRIEGDAWLAARLVRSYARQWLDGSGRFAALLLTYLLEDTASQSLIQPLLDTKGAGAGGEPVGLSEVDPEEERGAIHPATDPELTGDADDVQTEKENGMDEAPTDAGENAPARGQAREPFEYGEILKAAGVRLTEQQAAVRYYRERALPHLVRYPSRRVPESEEPLPEGLEPWDLGGSLDEIDWLQSILSSPLIVPGVTTVQRVWGTSEGSEPRRVPLDLDIYVDSSGSMVNPKRQLSYPALAGAIVCLSALRAGARVQATLWSGAHQVLTTQGFVTDENKVLTVLTGYLGGGTAFPIHMLRDTYATRHAEALARPRHILVVSDDGVTTMFDDDERGRSGWEIAAEALARAAGGGTFVLNLPDRQEPIAITRARTEGWDIHRVSSWEHLLEFAREFSSRAYGDEARTDTSPRR